MSIFSGLSRVLNLCRRTTGADAGSIILVDVDSHGEPTLVIKYSYTFSKNLPYEQKRFPFDEKSIAGYVATTGETLNIADVSALSDEDPVSFNPYFDITYNYRTKSMLVVPLCDHWDHVVGVIELINCKEVFGQTIGIEASEILLDTDRDFETKVVPFDERYVSLAEAIAGQAAIALENNTMINQIENQFDQFVKASISAIESRDPPTSGHSSRVAKMCVKTAISINDNHEGVFASVNFADAQLKELELAGLLHDFGKLYIEPSILRKGKKLLPKDYALLVQRLHLIERSINLDLLQNALAPTGNIVLDNLIEEMAGKSAILHDIGSQIEEINEPAILNRSPEAMLSEIKSHSRNLSALDPNGKPIPLLTGDEIENLRVQRGTLNFRERSVLQDHVDHTYNFVREIPWPEELQRIPDIILKHHERLDGSGYPKGISHDNGISLQARILMVVDVYDALVAADRPYKKALPVEIAFSILRDEATHRKLDPNVVELFITEKAFVV